MKRTDITIIIFIISTLLNSAWIIYHNDPEHEIIYVNNTVEVPVEVVKEVERLQVVTVEVPAPFPVYVNNTKLIYMPIAMPQNDWESEAELMEFISMDKTNRIDYSNDFDCDDFALRMIHNAALIGRRVYYFYEWKNGTYDGNHIMCMAYVKEEALYIIWEPQNDQVWSKWSSTVGG